MLVCSIVHNEYSLSQASHQWVSGRESVSSRPSGWHWNFVPVFRYNGTYHFMEYTNTWSSCLAIYPYFCLPVVFPAPLGQGEAKGKLWGCWMCVSIVLIDLMVSYVFMSVKRLELYTWNMCNVLYVSYLTIITMTYGQESWLHRYSWDPNSGWRLWMSLCTNM